MPMQTKFKPNRRTLISAAILKVFSNGINTVTFINLCLAAVAFSKDLLAAAYLGTSSQADSFWLAYFLPDMLVNNLLGISLGVACVPVFARIHVTGRDDRLRAIVTNLIWITAFFALLLFITMFLSRTTVVALLGEGLKPDEFELSVNLFAVMIPAVLTFPIIGVGTALLQVNNRFAVPAFAPVVFNAVFLAMVLCGYIGHIPIGQGVYLIAYAVLAGIIAMALVIWLGIRAYGLGGLFSQGAFPETREDITDVSFLLWPFLLILASSQMVFAAERFFGSHLQTGSVAALTYAFRIAQFPLWVFVAAISTVILPSMSRAAARGRLEEINRLFGRALKLILIITTPVALTLCLLREPVIAILFQRGSFSANSVLLTSDVLLGYAISIVFQGIAVLCLRTCMVLGLTIKAFWSFAAAAFINIGLDFILVGSYGISGLGYGAAVGAIFNAFGLLFVLHKFSHLNIKDHRNFTLKIIFASVCLIPLNLFLGYLWDSTGVLSLGSKALYIVLAVMILIIVYWLALKILKIKDFLVLFSEE